MQIIQRTDKALKTLSHEQSAHLSRIHMMKAFGDLLNAMKSKAIPHDMVEAVMTSWAIKHVESDKVIQQAASSIPPSFFPSSAVLPDIDLYSGVEKQTKLSLLNVSDFLWATSEDKSLCCSIKTTCYLVSYALSTGS